MCTGGANQQCILSCYAPVLSGVWHVCCKWLSSSCCIGVTADLNTSLLSIWSPAARRGNAEGKAEGQLCRCSTQPPSSLKSANVSQERLQRLEMPNVFNQCFTQCCCRVRSCLNIRRSRSSVKSPRGYPENSKHSRTRSTRT